MLSSKAETAQRSQSKATSKFPSITYEHTNSAQPSHQNYLNPSTDADKAKRDLHKKKGNVKQELNFGKIYNDTTPPFACNSVYHGQTKS